MYPIMLLSCLLLHLYIKKNYFRGPPKTKRKKASTCSVEISIALPTPTSGMVFPHNEAVAIATHKKRKINSSTKIGVTKKEGASNHYNK